MAASQVPAMALDDRFRERSTARARVGRIPTIVENALLGCPVGKAPKLIPGVLLTTATVVVAVILTDLVNQAWGYTGFLSYVLAAIVLGILVRNIVGLPRVFEPGVTFAFEKVLKLGIILMGVRISFSDMVTIGVWGVPIVVGCILSGLLPATYFTRLLKLPIKLGVLVPVGTSICGTSAIAATAPGIKAKDDEVAYAVASITLFGIYSHVRLPLHRQLALRR